jgi:hypothetical protein
VVAPGPALGVLVALGVVLASCGSDDGDGGGSGGDLGVPVRESSQGEPGTVLRDGVVVQEGTVLVGTPIPGGVGHFYRGEPVVDLGWWALLFVHGDPEEVMEEYLRHAEEGLGLERDEIPAGAPEYLREDLPADQQRYTNCGVAAEGSRGWRCVGAAFSDGGAPCAHFDLVRRKAYGTVESFLLVRYIVNPNGCVPGSTPLIGDPDAVPPPLPSDWPALPTSGSVLDDSWGRLAGLRIEDDSAVATIRFAGPDCGVAALLEVSGDSLDVLDGYVAQLDQRVGPDQSSPPLVTKVDDRTEVRQVHRAEGGGGDLYTATLVRHAEGPDYLVLGACSG